MLMEVNDKESSLCRVSYLGDSLTKDCQWHVLKKSGNLKWSEDDLWTKCLRLVDSKAGQKVIHLSASGGGFD